ncbi:hypothetical protein BSKO_05915 [Bryopsis sp. KO-2023]|nr:hypothetical protein BSKO_05915 [Bryopsis sp. KO-2023]
MLNIANNLPLLQRQILKPRSAWQAPATRIPRRQSGWGKTSNPPPNTTNTASVTLPGGCKSSAKRGESAVMRCVAGVGLDTAGGWVDEYTELDDRRDLTTLPLPPIKTAKRVVIVRHGQSTWNAEGRIQGCSDLSVLTELGKAQAQTTQELLADENFDMLINSPLQRASETAEIVWNNREGPRKVMPVLREIDLFSFQGLMKGEGKSKFGDLYLDWQKKPWDFEIDGHAPVRELWYRASLAWRDILLSDDSCSTVLVVAHNAVNQALICSAVGLPPTHFRRLLQSNAATTVVDFQPSDESDGPPRVTLNKLNQSPDPPFRPDGAGRASKARLVLVRNGGTESTEAGLVIGRRDEACSAIGELLTEKTADLLRDLNFNVVVSSPLARAKRTSELLVNGRELVGNSSAPIQTWDELMAWEAGEWEMSSISEVRGGEFPKSGEPLEEFWARMGVAWNRLTDLVEKEETKVAVVSAHDMVLSGILGHCLGMGAESMSLFRHDLGSVTIIDFPDSPKAGKGVVRCANYSAHLGTWAVPVTRDDWEMVCGIDGCF